MKSTTTRLSIRNSIVIIFKIFSFLLNGMGKREERMNENPGKMSVERRRRSGKKQEEDWKNVLLSPLCDRSYGTGSFML